MTSTPADSQHRNVLDAFVESIGGAARPGQVAMADAVAAAFTTGVHTLVQAGTGTGKSLGYLAPSIDWVHQHRHGRVVIATATLALQNQLAEADIPAALAASEKVFGRRPRAAVLKGRSNHACLLRVREGAPDDQGALVTGADLLEPEPARPESASASTVGAEVVALREWAEKEARDGGVADRDHAPSHGAQAWSQVSVSVRECLGAQRCPFGEECLVERSREKARDSQIIVTNHALLAIDAMHGNTTIPEHDHLIIDEAHELVARVTGAASLELSPQAVERAWRRVNADLADETALDLVESGETLRAALDSAALGRVLDPESGVVAALNSVRTATRAALSGLTENKDATPEQRQGVAAVREVFDTAERMAALSGHDVVWVLERERAGRELRVAPLSVAGLMRERVLKQHTTVLTSATLQVGGDFTSVAGSIGLRVADRVEPGAEPAKAEDDDSAGPWCGLDVGSPFSYARQGILHVARHLPPPSRDGIGKEALDLIAELVWAAGGRTLGLFSSQRSAEAAAIHVRREVADLTVLCQGQGHLPDLTARFKADETTSLFGTLSLWQGIDVPGPTCSLVIIDKLPFPRPDDPLMQARQQAVAEAGGNGFMAVAATHAALLMAQGAGRLIRRGDDRGVVAVLDPRLATARYGAFLRASMPPMWPTEDPEVAIAALRRLVADAAPTSV